MSHGYRLGKQRSMARADGLVRKKVWIKSGMLFVQHCAHNTYACGNVKTSALPVADFVCTLPADKYMRTFSASLPTEFSSRLTP